MTSPRVSSRVPAEANTAARAADAEARLAAVPESVTVARQLLLAFIEDVEPGHSMDITVAVSEAATNAVEHGGAGRPDRAVRLRIWRVRDELTVEITDDGPGIRPGLASEKAGLGLGLSLMIAIADEARFGTGEGGGMRVELRFDLDRTGAGAR